MSLYFLSVPLIEQASVQFPSNCSLTTSKIRGGQQMNNSNSAGWMYDI